MRSSFYVGVKILVLPEEKLFDFIKDCLLGGFVKMFAIISVDVIVVQTGLTIPVMFTNKVIADVDMFRLRVLYWVLYQRQSALIVILDDGRVHLM